MIEILNANMGIAKNIDLNTIENLAQKRSEERKNNRKKLKH